MAEYSTVIVFRIISRVVFTQKASPSLPPPCPAARSAAFSTFSSASVAAFAPSAPFIENR
jgi:hypothetical protein